MTIFVAALFCSFLAAPGEAFAPLWQPKDSAVPPKSSTSRLFAHDRRAFFSKSAAASLGNFLLLQPSPRPANAAENEPSASASISSSSSSAKNEPRIALWGYGNQNQLMAKYLAEQKFRVVSVIGRHNVGDDYGMVESAWGNIGKKTGVRIVGEQDAAAEFAKTRPNVCLMCTRSTIADLKNSLVVCAKSKCNVITIAEELLDSRTSSPKITKEMDLLFQQEGVSFTGSGFLDGACCEMTMTLASMMHRIDKLEGGIQYSADEYGPFVANLHGIGLTKKEFAKFAKQGADKSYVYHTNEWFVSALGLTLDKTTEVREPTFATVPLFSKSLNKEIPVGDATGMSVIATTTTKEGVTIVGKQSGKCYEETDSDSVEFKFEGEPSGVSFRMENLPATQMTDTAAISRIYQILDAPPGYVTSDKLGTGTYHKI